MPPPQVFEAAVARGDATWSADNEALFRLLSEAEQDFTEREIEKAAGAPGGTFLVYLLLPHSLIARQH